MGDELHCRGEEEEEVSEDRNHSSRGRLQEIIFEADTPLGKLFDVVLIISIVFSVLVVMLDSVASVREHHGDLLTKLEWFFTILFTVEYALRLYCVRRPLLYARSFFGVIDLLAVLPTYIGVLLPGSHYLAVIRVLRVLRIFRVLKLAQYLGEARILMQAVKASARKIVVFLFVVLTLVVVLGSVMYVVEGGENGFTSIPQSVYWSIVTLTTVGYGDISPQTPLGQALAAVIMILGYSIIVVPTGFVAVETAVTVKQGRISTQSCPTCSAEGHDVDAVYCKYCGGRL
ncbi:MAG: ion transporter [Verrucomicrobia bacterium]|nr:ion transporter [Verrucomicrobiota bacterium]